MNNLLQNNLKTVIIFSILYIVAIITILIFIWMPEKKAPEIVKYSNIDQDIIDKMTLKKYMDELIESYQLKNSSLLYNKMEESFWEYTSETPEDLNRQIELLDTNNPTVGNVKKYFSGNTVIYSAQVSFGNQNKQINLIEDYPGSYVYSTGTFYKYNYKSKNNPIEGMGFFVKSIYQDMNYMTVDIDIYNNNDSSSIVKMENISDVQLILEDERSISMNNVNVAKGNQVIKSGAKSNKELVFNIPVEVQGQIKRIQFNRVSIDGAEKSLEFKLEL